MAGPLIDADVIRRAVAVAGAQPPAAVGRVEQAGPRVWRVEAAGTPVTVAQADDDAAALGVAVLELQWPGPPIPRRPAVAALEAGQVLPLAVASTYPAVWAALRTTAGRGDRPERTLAALAVRYVDCDDVDTNQLLVTDLADLADHIDSRRAQTLGVTPLQFASEPPTWAAWSYGLARSGVRPHRLDLLHWRIRLAPTRPEIVIDDRRTDVPSAFYRP